jgi:ankyrin repeat protein
VFPFDSEITTSAVYRRNQAKQNLRIRLTEENIAQINEQATDTLTRPKEPENETELMPMRSKDSALGSSILSPTTESDARSDFSPRMKEPSLDRSRSNASIPARKPSKSPLMQHMDSSQTWSRPVIQVSSHSNPVIPSLISEDNEEDNGNGSKWSLLSIRKSKRRTKSAEGHLSPVSSRRRVRPRGGSDVDLRTSIDFASSEGLSAPDIVRAAQAGSVREIEELIERGSKINQKHKASGKTALAVASHCGNDDAVALLLRREADPTIPDSDEMTPLHLAASRGHYRAVQLLLQERVDVDTPGPGRRTAFRMAADEGDLDVMKLLLQHGAKTNTRDAQNKTALHSAAMRGDQDVAKLLLSNNVDFEAKDADLMAAIHHACTGNTEGHEAVVAALLAKGKFLESLGQDGMSPLCYASASGSERIVKYLLRKNANIKHRDNSKMTAVHWAAFNGHVEVVDLLLSFSAKAPVEAKTADGRTALHLAVMSKAVGRFATVELLLRKSKGLLEVPCANGMRALHYACEEPDDQVTGLLLGAGAQVNAAASTQGNPIHIAAKMGSVKVVSQLLDKNADPDARDPKLDRALGIACIHGHLEVVHEMLNRNVQLRSRFTDKGRSHEDSPLCLASKHGHLMVVEELIKRGASVWERDENSWQPLRYAAFHGHPDVVQVLLGYGASISGLAPSGGWGFALTAGRIGFAKDVSEARKDDVLRLLHTTEAAENARATETTSHTYSAPSAPPSYISSGAVEKDDDRGPFTPFVMEKDNDQVDVDTQRDSIPAPFRAPPPVPSTDTSGEETNTRSGIRRVLSRFQSNRPRASGPHATGNSQVSAIAEDNEDSLRPPQSTSEHFRVSSMSGTTDTLPYNSSSTQYRPTPPHSVSPMPTPQYSSPMPPGYAVSPMPTVRPPDPPVSEVSQASPVHIQPPYPLSRSETEVTEVLSQAEAVSETVFEDGDVVACESCSDKGFTRPDMSCTACRRVLYEYRYIMGQLTSDPSRESRGAVFELPAGLI